MNYTSKKWHVFYTHAKFERKIHEYLQQENYESFLPLHWVIRQWSDRRKRIQVPLFPNYIFVNIEYNKIIEILKTPKLISCVKCNKIPVFLKQKEVDSIRQIVENEYPFEVSCNLKIGDSVEITRGPLTGMEGVLVEERGNHRFALRLESIQQSMLVSVPSYYLELAETFV